MKKYVVITDWLVSYVTLEHYRFAQKIGWEPILLSQLDLSLLQEPVTLLFITYNDFDFTKAPRHPECRIIYKVDDYHGENATRLSCLTGAHLVISPYAYLIREPARKLWIPYSCVDEFVQGIAFNHAPRNAVFTSGAVDPVYYPFRSYVQSLNDPRIVRQAHPGYHNKYSENPPGVAKNFQNILNSYLCCFTDALICGYVLLKNFEIAGSGSLLLTDSSIEAQMNELGFFDGINCMFSTQETFQEKLEFILDPGNRSHVDEMRRAGMALVHSKHLTSHRAKFFNETYQEALEKPPSGHPSP